MPQIKEIDSEFEVNICPVCNDPALQTCSACKQVVYCSKDHQKIHWKTHKLACRTYEVKSTPELGRYLVASRDLQSTDKILFETPLVIGPKLSDPTPVCLGCYRPPHEIARCPRCLWPTCSPNCPGLCDPQHHAIECVVLSLGRHLILQQNDLRYEIITPLRCLLLQKRNIKKWQQILAMEAHMKSRGPASEVYKYLEDRVVNHLMDGYLSNLPEGSLNQYTKDLLHFICGVLDVNAIEIRSAGNIDLFGIYTNFSLLEHQCVPNTKYFLNNEYRLTLIPTENIKRGEHLSTTYTHVLWGTEARREHLKERKYFLCSCRRCSDPTELGTYLSALRCHGLYQDNFCGKWQLPEDPLDENSDWKCERCSATLTANEAQNLINMLASETEEAQQREKPSVAKVSDVLNKVEQFLHPHHYLCYELKHLLIQLFGHQPGYFHNELSVKQLQYKSDICRDLLSINKVLDQGCSRLQLYTAVILYELHSAILELVNRDQLPKDTSTAEARKFLVEAADILENEPTNTPGSDMKILLIKCMRVIDSK